LKGTVTEIANSANIHAQGTTSQKTEFEVTLAIESAKQELRPGMYGQRRHHYGHAG